MHAEMSCGGTEAASRTKTIFKLEEVHVVGSGAGFYAHPALSRRDELGLDTSGFGVFLLARHETWAGVETSGTSRTESSGRFTTPKSATS